MGKKRKKAQRKKQKRTFRLAFTLENERHYLDLVQTAIQSSKFRQASVELKNVRKCNPNADLSEEEVKIRCLRGSSFLDKKELEAGLAEFQSALNIIPQHQEAIVGMCRYYLESDQIAAGLGWIKGLFEDNELSKDLSVLYLKFFLLSDKAKDAAAVVEKYPGKFWAADKHWFNGVLALQNKDFKEAGKFFFKAKKSGVFLHQARAWITWARAQDYDWKTFNFVDKIESESLRKRIKQDIYIQYFPYRQHFGNMFSKEQERLRRLVDEVKRGDWINAANMLDNPPLQFPDSFKNQRQFKGHIYRLAAIFAIDKNNPSLGVRFASKASRFFPDDLDMSLDFCLRFAEKPTITALFFYSRAAELLNKKHKKNPKKYPKRQVEYYLGELDALKSSIYSYKHEMSKAKELCRSALKKAPDSYHTLSWTGVCHELDDNPKEAAVYAEKAFHKGGCQRQDYHWIVDLLDDAEDNKKLREFRLEFGGRFDDEVFSDERLRRNVAFALTKKDHVFLERTKNSIEKDIEIVPVYNEIMRLFTKIYKDNKKNFHSNKKASVKPKELDYWIKKNLLPLDPNSFAYITATELIIYGLKHIRLKKKDQKILSTLEGLSRRTLEGPPDEQMSFGDLDPDRKLAKQSYLLSQITLKKDQKTIRKHLEDYLRRCDYLSDGLIELQWILSAYGHAETLQVYLKEQLRKDPENPGLNLAYAESLPKQSMAKKTRFQKKGLEIARRLQNQKALDAHKERQRLEETWIEYQHTSPFGNIFKDFMNSMDMDMDDLL